MQQGRVAVGHPIDVGSGAQFTAWEDIEVDGHFSLIWRRSYSTELINAAPSSPLGIGWVHSFDVTLRRVGDAFVFRGPDGMDVAFPNAEQGLAQDGFLLDPARSLELRRCDGCIVLYHWHDWDDEVHKFIFRESRASLLRLHRQELASGHGVGLTYDASGRLRRIQQDIEARCLCLEYEGEILIEVHLEAREGGKELVCSYEYDECGRLIAVADVVGARITYGYDEQHRLNLEKDASGGTYRMKYDDQGRCVECSGDKRFEYRRLCYSANGRLTTVTDSLGRQVVYHLAPSGQVITEVYENGESKQRSFDAHGRVIAETTADGRTTQYRYDSKSNVCEEILPNGGSIKVEFDDHHQPLCVTEADGARWELEYQRGALICTRDPLGRETRYVRNTANVIEEVRTPVGGLIRYRRDAAWTYEECVDAYGLIEAVQFDRRMNVIAIYDAHGLVRSLKYDATGELIGASEPDGSSCAYDRDLAGRVKAFTDANGARTTLQYDSYSQLTKVINANGAEYRFLWDTEGQLNAVVNPLGETASFKYDACGNLTQRTSFDGRTERYVYDASGRCVKRLLNNDQILVYTYSPLDSITTVSADGVQLIGNVYDPCGELVETTTPQNHLVLKRDLCGEIVEEVQVNGAVRYTIGDDGLVAASSHAPSSVADFKFSYDLRGRLRCFSAGEEHTQSYQYDAADLTLSRSLGYVTETFEYDTCRRLSRQRVAQYSRQLVDRGFDYDAASNLIAERDSLRGDSYYTYGPTELLLRSDHAGLGSVEYRYDACGNMLQRNGEQLHYEFGNRLVRKDGTSYRLDREGRRTAVVRNGQTVAEYRWDALDQLIEIVHPDDGRTLYEYDGLGRRVRKTHRGVETRYLWAGDSLLREETGGSAIEYAIGEFMADAIWIDGAIRHVVQSWRGVASELFDDDGRMVWRGSYDDWGMLFAHEGKHTSPGLRLAGQEFDPESGLHYNRFRYYDPEAGRFISADPLGFAASFNEYLYAPNAIGWEDPFGLYCGKKKCGYSVYVLKNGRKVVYMGITSRAVKTRMKEHARSPDKKGKFTSCVVIATGKKRVGARNIEGSGLKNIARGKVPGAVPKQDMLNSKTKQGDLYHSYNQNTKGPGRVIETPAQTSQHLKNPVVDSKGKPVKYTNP